jgi:hypothetical protein
LSYDRSTRDIQNLTERDSGVHVELGDDAKYEVKGDGTILFQLELGGSFDDHDVLYVLGLKNNFLSILSIEDMDFAVTFQRGQVVICQKKDSPNTTIIIGVREGSLYRLQGNPVKDLVYDNDSLCEIWHMRLRHLHDRVFPILRKIVTGLQKFSVE